MMSSLTCPTAPRKTEKDTPANGTSILVIGLRRQPLKVHSAEARSEAPGGQASVLPGPTQCGFWPEEWRNVSGLSAQQGWLPTVWSLTAMRPRAPYPQDSDHRGLSEFAFTILTLKSPMFCIFGEFLIIKLQL